MNNENLVYHCCPTGLLDGGVGTYVNSLLNSKMPGVSEKIINQIDNIDQSKFGLLHIHDPILLADWRGECPAIFSLHNHAVYCPSGTKYLPTRGVTCSRQMSHLGCLWGHFVDGCGSRRPEKVVQGLRWSFSFLEILQKRKIPVIAYSDYVRNQLIKNGLPPQQVTKLYYGIRLPQIASGITTAPLTQEIHRHRRILFAGRIVPDKGLEWLLKALAKTDSSIELDIAGDGWDKPRLENLAHQMGLTNRIVWHGWCNGEKLEKLYNQCFAVIFPSVWHEPAGLITLEAYARYRPIIASAVGGIPEHVQKNTGILIESNNIDQLAGAINDLSQDYQKSRALGEQGHALLMKEFTLEIHTQRLQQIYDQKIDNSPISFAPGKCLTRNSQRTVKL